LSRRVVITGLGLVTPLGVGVDETWSALCEGRSGIGEITSFDTTGFTTKIAAEVKGFNAEDFLPKKEARRTEKFIAYAVAAARMAVENACLTIDDTNGPRVGVITGCGLGGLHSLEMTAYTVQNKGPKRCSPFFIPMLIGNMAPGMISIHLGAKGPNISVATACAAGAHAYRRCIQHHPAGTGGRHDYRRVWNRSSRPPALPVSTP
jgi:3-oxoacyl-[acyl-carrier-protein] synthase II